MEILSSNPFSESLKRFQRRRGYKRFATAHRKNKKSVRFGGGSPQPVWRIKVVPKLMRVVISSPLRVWRKLKNAYVNMMIHLSADQNIFGGKRIPKARHLPIAYSPAQFDNRLVLEIYKSLVASRELATT